ncbi:MAG: NAD(+) synthase [Candidatus Caldatribacteriaceae bacterium]
MENWEKEIKRITKWMKEKVEEAGAQGLVFGMSGGIDSSLVAVLAKMALRNQILGLIMPCYSIAQDMEDALEVARRFAIPYQILSLEEPFEAFLKILGENKENRVLYISNLKPRLRMCALYYFANKLNYLVCGSSNRSEITVGYFTKYGDGAVDIAPLAHLTKSEVRSLAKYLGIPEHIVTKPPSAGFWPGQTDEGEMGIPYEQIDLFIQKGSAEEPYLSKIQSMVKRNQHKLRPPLNLLFR